MAAFKDHIDRPALQRLAEALRAQGEGFAHDQFLQAAAEGLGPLELKARVAHVAAALAAHLTGSFAESAARVEGAVSAGGPWSSFDLWPVQHWAMVAGIDHPSRATALIARVTRHFSGEFAVRPFIDRDPVSMAATLAAWAADPDEHVRRLASEGSRPRLPWGPKLTVPPGWALGVLEALRDDPAEYVRRSVANHLNDVSHLDPELALATARRWHARPSAHTPRMVRHALRTLVKRGHPEALGLVGADTGAAVTVEEFSVAPTEIEIGEGVVLTLRVRSEQTDRARVVIDYRVGYLGASGVNPKTFKWTTLDLPPGESITLTKRQHFRDVSIRTHRPGAHTITVLVNGKVGPTVTVLLRARAG